MALAVFVADDGVAGTELWATDGTAAGTKRLTDVSFDNMGSELSRFMHLGSGRLLFSVSHLENLPGGGIGEVHELRVTDGTAAGTFEIKEFYAAPTGMTSLGGGRAVFAARLDTGWELWVTDGTVAGTSLVKDIWPGPTDGLPTEITSLGHGRALFIANNGVVGRELWVTDGTASGTTLVRNIGPGVNNFSNTSADFTPLGDGRLAFWANDGGGLALWSTDGTAAGTFEVKHVFGGNLVALQDGRIAFYELGGEAEDFFGLLNVTDGTASGTRRVSDVELRGQINMAEMPDGRLLFTTQTEASGHELWITDFTSAGTRLLKDINPGVGDSEAQGFTALGDGSVVFSAYRPANGWELWVTDGTTAGTRLVKDIWPGFNGSNPTELAPLGDGRVLLQANNGRNGWELWVTDGTAAGTRMVKDIAPGTYNGRPLDSQPIEITTLVEPNHRPFLAMPLADQVATEGRAFGFTIPADSFTDRDAGDILTLAATLANGDALPAWLSFSPMTRALSGTPDDAAAGVLAIRVRATDSSGSSVSGNFSLTIGDRRLGGGEGEILVGTAGPDSLDGAGGGDSLAGGDGNDTLVGGAGNDTLDGGVGTDRLIGGTGDDLYIVAAGDVLVEAVGQGIDTVRTSLASYVLAANVENLVATTGGARTFTGNAPHNAITGGAGADTLFGLAGNDTLDGSTGIDRLVGGTGNDFHITTAGDVVVEGRDQGIDTISANSGTSAVLSANVEVLLLTGNSLATGTGNGLSNVIVGNAAANTLYGLAGADTLSGGAGIDVLIGGPGRDVLEGGVGGDQFRLLAATDSAVMAPDAVLDFTFSAAQGFDRIDLRTIDANPFLIGNQAFAFLGTAQFGGAGSASAGQLRTISLGGNHYRAEGDINGDGSADFAIEITSASVLVQGWFLL